MKTQLKKKKRKVSRCEEKCEPIWHERNGRMDIYLGEGDWLNDGVSHRYGKMNWSRDEYIDELYHNIHVLES